MFFFKAFNLTLDLLFALPFASFQKVSNQN